MKSLTDKDKEYAEWWDSIAFDYESKVLSALAPNVKNPIFKFVSKLNSKDYKRVVDLGCGPGNFLPFLSQHFEEVRGLELSKNMLKVARKRVKGIRNVRLNRYDIRDLKAFYEYFDIAFSINTIAPYNISIAESMIGETFKALRKGGLFVGTFPAFDAVLYQRELTYQHYLEQGLSNEEAFEKTDDYFVKQNKIDLQKGMYADNGIHVQKFFTEGEIHFLLRHAGFTNIVTEKVLYPWTLSKKHGYGYFPNMPEIWDWYFVAHK